jgi:hypothetical protein
MSSPAYVTTNTGRRVQARYGFDPVWTGHFTGYALRIHCSDSPVSRICKDILPEARIDRAEGGWAAIIDGDPVEVFATKTEAQCAVEDLLGIRPY